jgi:hypothetical protein
MPEVRGNGKGGSGSAKCVLVDLGGNFAFVFFFLKSSEGFLGAVVVDFAPCNSPPRFLAWSAKIKANDVDVAFA